MPSRKLIAGLIVVALIAGGGVVYHYKTTGSEGNKSKPVNTVNYDPPTKQDEAETKAFKDNQQKQASTPSTPAPTAADGRTKVTPVISYGGQYDNAIEISAFVSGIFEDGGTCTLTMTNGSATITRTTAGTKDATTTRCALFSIPAKDVSPKGSWKAVVAYSSSTSAGSSETTSIQVQ